jgi:hypothetical protein
MLNACIWSSKSLRKCLVTNSSKKHALTSTTVNKKTRGSWELSLALVCKSVAAATASRNFLRWHTGRAVPWQTLKRLWRLISAILPVNGRDVQFWNGVNVSTHKHQSYVFGRLGINTSWYQDNTVNTANQLSRTAFFYLNYIRYQSVPGKQRASILLKTTFYKCRRELTRFPLFLISHGTWMLKSRITDADYAYYRLFTINP